ncbi:Polyisoprenoid-binding protein YceI [Arenibacter nanhaiticus]|uniref:Polyisoprenoid-binding protein YceI n=1 Tax=Arenibacter nanhaiticus TaxID=558155 RepID=A0A1M6FAY9_9FLAO|nr:YceI family protein [Arenibacter nanhaiticus]SHI94835.1 Polyisoprenoid-binding protein YceI [Arenibacter nanhaiticus]
MKNILLLLLLLTVVFMSQAQETYSLSPKSVITINGSSTVSDWMVEANAMKGAIQNKENLIKDLSLEVTVEKIHSERGASMDKKLHSALKMEEHPQVTFKLKALTEKGASASKGTIKGLLTIAGVTKDVVLSCEIRKVDKEYFIKGNKEINLLDYNIEPPTAMFGQIVVGEKVSVNFDLRYAKD